jgi:PKD repeat protein
MILNMLFFKFYKKHKYLFKSSVFFSVLISAFILISCSGDSGNGNGGGSATTPSNLVVSAVVAGTNAQNPNGDGSGTVNFSISATNATSYKILLGNGETKEFTDGNFTYTYTASGTYTYVIYVSAYNSGKFVSASTSITIYIAPTALWSDEFNVDGAPNSSKWGYDLGAGGWGNNESQFYTNRPENIIVQNGVLKIKTIKESYSGSNYTSARILSKDKFSFKYGKVEIKAKLPVGGGIWPALWMLGNNINTVGWPACGEIDIMEHVGSSPNKIYGTLHHPGHSGGNADGGTTIISNATTEFHLYTLDWRADSIKFYVDNQLFYSFTNSASLPFNQNFFLIINCAIGGNFGGAIDPNFTSSIFEIDYVRVYN